MNAGSVGICLYTALVAALKQLQKAEAGSKHVFLFADASDAEDPGAYRELLETAVKAGITFSVVGLGSPNDPDAALLEEIARLGKGQAFFTQDPMELPQIFSQDTILMAHSTFIEEPTEVRLARAMKQLSFRNFQPPTLAGYNLCYLKPGANLGMETMDQYRAPVLAWQQVGAGRVVCLTADISQHPSWDAWPELDGFLASLAVWCLGNNSGQVPGGIVETQLQQGNVRFDYCQDPDQKAQEAPRLTLLSEQNGIVGARADAPFVRLSQDHWRAEVPLSGEEVLLPSFVLGPKQSTALPIVKAYYSNEYRPPEKREPGLAKLAELSNGRHRTDLASIWSEIPIGRRPYELAPWLIAMAILALLAQVLLAQGRAWPAMWQIKAGPSKQPAAQAAKTRQAAQEKQAPKAEQEPELFVSALGLEQVTWARRSDFRGVGF